jgi:hypothetical protein
MRRVAVVVVLPLLSLFVAAPAQAAAVYTSNGVRCTKVGTAGNDVLKGTSGRDVLCGMGGNDRLIGGGGNDVLDGGSGNDVLDGGTGNDVLLGGSGNDTITADVGTDRADGGTGTDTVSGGDGNDTVSGGDGNDKVSGDAGDDTLNGGAGDDTLTGSTGRDSLSGGTGNDDLDGGPDADGIHGDAGTNWCTIDSADTRTQCVYDRTAPTIVEAVATPDTVDVTDQDVPVVLRVHLQDDTGVTSVQLGLQPSNSPPADSQPSNGQPADTQPSFQGGLATLVSGTVRDGWWQYRGTATRYGEPGTYPIDVSTRDRVGRWTYAPPHETSMTINDANPDRTRPDVTAFSITPSSVDVRAGDAKVSAVAHVVDQGSGSDHGDIFLCLDAPNGDGTYSQYGSCLPLTRTSGDRLDGDWTGTMTVPEGSTGGDWNAMLVVTDAVHRGRPDLFFGPDEIRNRCDPCSEPRYRQLPDGTGRFTVAGTADSHPAVVQDLRADNPDVDTLPGPATVIVDVHATDAPGEGVTAVNANLTPEGGQTYGQPSFAPVDATLVAGDAEDGIWRLTFQLPQGTPPGRYPIAQVMISDKTHTRTYAPAASPSAGQPNEQPINPDQMTRADANGPSWDGVVTVQQHTS